MIAFQSIEPQLFRWSTTKYNQLVEAGILSPEDRVELLDGQIVFMSPSKSRHAGFIDRLNNFLSPLLGKDYIIRVQNPVWLDEYSEPEPDIAVLNFKSSFYTDQHPQPEDIVLVVEISDTSLARDREIKIPLYARAGIPEYWIVNLIDNRVEQYTEPSENGYRNGLTLGIKDTLTSDLAGAIRVADFWV